MEIRDRLDVRVYFRDIIFAAIASSAFAESLLLCFCDRKNKIFLRLEIASLFFFYRVVKFYVNVVSRYDGPFEAAHR